MEKLLKELNRNGIPVLKVFRNDIIVNKKDLIKASDIRDRICPEKDSSGFHKIVVKCYWRE